MTTDDWIKIGVGIIGGGLFGALYTNWRTDRRNKIQPIEKKVSVSYLNVPKIVQGYSAFISIKGQSNIQESKTYNFEQLAIIQLELTNVGNRDFQTFPFAITLPIKNTIIGIQYEGEGRLHKATFSPEINIDNPSPQVDILLEPFNRKEKYSISFVINASEKELEKNIQLDKVLPIACTD